jgi:superfamily II DNA or RNA helicase
VDIQLRPYQQEAKDAFFDALVENRRQLIVLPTGAGKTVVFGAIARQFHEQVSADKPILVIAHRSELLDQAEQKLQMVWPRVFTGRIQAERNEQLGEVLFASTQTLVAGRAVRPPGLIIYDEAHHSRADGAYKVLERLGVFEPDGPMLLGVTATPSRSDKNELGDIFTHLTYERTILQMIMDGYLADVRGVKVSVPGLNLRAIRTTAGDYNAKDLSYALNGDEALDAVVEAVQEHAADRKSLVFAVDVKHGQALAKRFKEAGVASASIDGTMPPQERASILTAFEKNQLRVLVNCQILTEGYDEPSVDTVVIARPTRSSSLYTQMVGRALRLHPNKVDALVLDLTGASDDKSLQTFTRLMKTQKKAKPDVVTMVNDEADDASELPMDDGESVGEWINRVEHVKREKAVVQAINLFVNRSRYRWQQVKEMFAICYADTRWAYLYRDGNEFWPVLELNHRKFMPLHDRPLPLEYAQGIAEGFLELLESKLIQKDADWRIAPMSEKQAAILDKYRIAYQKEWTRGMASDALNQVFAQERVNVLSGKFVPQKWVEFLSSTKGKMWLEQKVESFRAYAESRQQGVR